MDRESGMAGRVAVGRNGDNAGRDFGAGFEWPHLLGDVLEDAPRIEEIAMHRAGRPAHVAVVHPEFPFRLRHQDFRVAKDLVAVLGLDAVDMVGMEMRNDDGVDRLRRDAGGGEIGVHEAGAVGDLPGGAGVDQHQFGAGVHQQSGE